MEILVKDEDRATKGMLQLKVNIVVSIEETLSSRSTLRVKEKKIMFIFGSLKGKRPKERLDHLWPEALGMKEHSACIASELSNRSFDNSGLVMGSNTTIGDGLPGGSDFFFKCRLSKPTIIGMVCFDKDTAEIMCPLFKSMCGCNGFFLRSCSHEVDINQVGEMVLEDSNSSNVFLGVSS